jgi:hypothetical protein
MHWFEPSASPTSERYRAAVQAATRGGANQLVDLVFEQPVVNTRLVERRLGLSRPAALNALRQLEAQGVLMRAGEGPRGQLRWRAGEVLALLTSEDTSPRREADLSAPVFHRSGRKEVRDNPRR